MVNFDENKCLIIDKTKGHLIDSISMAPNKIFPLTMPIKEKVYLSSIMVIHHYGIKGMVI